MIPTSVRLKDGRTATIRAARPDDAGAWLANVNSVGAERIYILTDLLDRSIQELRDQFRTQDPRNGLWLVAEIDGRVVGGGDVHRERKEKKSHVAQLGIALTRPYRGIGLGEALMQVMIRWAREAGVKRLRLGVFATNERAIGLYRKLGFVDEGRLVGEAVIDGRSVDELLMVLSL